MVYMFKQETENKKGTLFCVMRIPKHSFMVYMFQRHRTKSWLLMSGSTVTFPTHQSRQHSYISHTLTGTSMKNDPLYQTTTNRMWYYLFIHLTGLTLHPFQHWCFKICHTSSHSWQTAGLLLVTVILPQRVKVQMIVWLLAVEECW